MDTAEIIIHEPEPGSGSECQSKSSSCMGCCHDEFTLRSVSLDFPNDRVFYMCQWKCPHWAFCVFRVVTAVYATYVTLDFLIADLGNLKFLTDWSFLVLTLHLTVAAVLSLAFYSRGSSPVDLDPGLPNATSLPVESKSSKSVRKSSISIQLQSSENSNQSSNTRHQPSNDLPSDKTKKSDKSATNEQQSSSDPWTSEHSRERSSMVPTKPGSSVGVQELSTAEYYPTDIISKNNSLTKETDIEKNHPLLTTSPTAWYFKLSWILSNISSPVAICVTVVFFVALYPKLYVEANRPLTVNSFNTHAMNLVMAVLDQVLSARPVRLLHVYQPIFYGVVYFSFSIIYFFVKDPKNGENIIYDILDWNKPTKTVILGLGLTLVALPLMQLFYVVLYRLKLWLYLKIYANNFK